ncbi:MAG: efflux RND transporter permease subunit [Lentisphaerales bacterium]|nr:MAG: efflux RND transporter permease subunit [Lentisphaerales bacterium]
MNLSRFAVHRPIFTIMVVLIVLILGGISLSRLPIDLMPDITLPTLSISTSYANAAPEEMEELVTRPIEEAVSAVPGVEEVTSSSSEGNSSVRVTFNWGTDLDTAANDIRDRLDRVIPGLPEDADRPSLRKFDLASFPVVILGASSRLDPVQMRRIIEDQIKYRVERVPGVASLDIWGGLNREIHVNINPDKIKALRLSLNQILDRIRAGNINLPAGSINRGNYEVTIRTPGQYATLDELRATVIADRSGTSILLGEIAEVEDSWQKITQLVRVNGEPGLRLSVNKQSGANTVEVAQGVLAEIEMINRDIPQIKLVPIINSAEFIQRSINNVGTSALFGGLLAVFVLLFFLRNLRSTLIIATAIPFSIVASFALMYFAGFTLNMMTLGGLALGIGMLVDNSIVVLENIYRLRQEQHDPMLAAVNGTEEVTSAIIASTLTTLAVFLPLIFVRGMAGIMFRQLSYVIAFALLCSLCTALTVVPMLASRLLNRVSPAAKRDEKRRLSLSSMSETFFITMESGYKRLLHMALEHRLVVIVGAVLLFGASLLLIPLVGTELMPQTDEGEVRVNAEMEVGTRMEIMDEKRTEIERLVNDAVPEIRNIVASVGGSHWHGRASHTGNLRISLVPQSERKRSSEEVAQEHRKVLSSIPGVMVRVRTSSGLFIMRRMASGSDKVEVQVRGHDLPTADALAQRILGVVEQVEGVTDADLSRDSGTPEESIIIDRRKAADMKLNVRQIAEALQTVLSGTRASDFREAGDEYRILVQVKDADLMELDKILDLTVSNTDGEPVVLRNVVKVQSLRGPVSIDRIDQERTISVSANLSDRDIGSVINDIRERLRSVPVPRGFAIVFGGEYEEQQKAFRELLVGFILALILVYMVMACQYESLRDPLVVMFAVPLATIVVILMFFLTNTTFNVQSYIGCIMLGGIVVNNAILLVDTTNLLRRRDGLDMRTAIEEAGRRRLRPILMTSLTTSLALLPLALGLGEGGEAQAPMARVVIGGLLSSTFITLLFVPVIYSVFEGLHFRRKQAVPVPGGEST